MFDDSDPSRRRVLRLSGGVLGAGLLATGAGTAQSGEAVSGGATGDGAVPSVTDITFYDVATDGLELGPIDIPDGERINPIASVGSGAFEAESTDQPAFFGVADGGPEIDCENAAALTGRSPEFFCGEESGSIRPVPEYTPSIYRFTLGDDGAARLTDRTELSDSTGDGITTLTNPVSNGTTPMFSIEGDSIPFDPNGVDLEGVTRAADGTFWLCEEYAPSLIEVTADGEVVTRHVPATIESDLSDATYPVEGSLPEVFKRRDRGIESIGMGPDGETVYFALQSPLANPDVAAFETSRNLRLGTFDPGTDEVSAQYLYRLDRPETFEKDAADGDVAQDDVKVSEMSVVGPNQLLVLERISLTTKFYLVNLSNVAPIPERYDQLSTRPTLTQVDPETDPDLDPVPKELLFTTDDYDGFPRKLEGIARPNTGELLILNDSDYELRGAETRVARVQFDRPLVDDLLEVGSVALEQGATGSVDLSLRSAVDGFAGARLTVSVTEPDVAEITGVSYSDATALTREPRISADGAAVELAVADVEKAVEPGATNVTLGSLELEGVGAGTTDLTIQVHRLDDEQGTAVEADTKDGLVVTGPPALGSGPAGGNAPTDPDGDGKYEDVNGNGRIDYADIELLFENLDSDAVQLNREAYDFNDNGQIDYDDVVELYEEQ